VLKKLSGLMKLKKISYIVLNALFVLQTLTLPMSIPELVLCVAEDHVRLEMKTVRTDFTHAEQAATALSALRHTYHNNDCVDIPLFQHVQQVIFKKHTSIFLRHYTAFFIPTTSENETASFSFVINNEFSSFSQQYTIRNVVLLI